MRTEYTVTKSQKLGFIGFGAMSHRMAKRLRDASHTVSAFDPGQDGEAVDGFTLFDDPAALTGEVDAVLVCVPDDHALAASMHGGKGVLQALRHGQLLINFSTVSPDASKSLAEEVAGRGGRYVEAPMSGSTPQAEDGTLVILAGGEEDDIRAAAPILDVVGRKTLKMGGAGDGLVAKLIVNGVMALGTAALAEGLAYGEQSGLDRGTLIGLLSDLVLVSEHHKHKLTMASAEHYPAEFPTKLMSKDMGLLLTDARERGVALPVMAAAAQLYAQAARRRPGDDYASAIAVAEALAADPRPGPGGR